MTLLQDAFRIGIHLPFGNPQEERAVREITNHFRYEYNGSTFSNVDKPAYNGTWKSKRGRKFEAKLCLMNIDMLLPKGEAGSFSIEAKANAMVSDIVSKAKEFYDMVGRPQKSFWITVTEMKISSAAAAPRSVPTVHKSQSGISG